MMFSEKQKEAYSAVKPPEELRERILASAEKSEKDNTVLFKTRFSRIAAVAACFVLVAVTMFYTFNSNGIEISVNGVAVEENSTVALTGAPAPLARNAAQAEINLKLDLDSDALITVDSGSFDVLGKESNLTEYSAEESVEIVWRSNGMQKSEMTVDYGRKTCVLVLEYNGEWIITRK